MGISVEAPTLLIGCGKMGGAMLDGWLERRVPPEQVTVIEPSPAAAEAFRCRAGLRILPAMDALDAAYRPTVVVFAVKPQEMEAVLKDCRRFAGRETVFLSIVAGKRIRFFEEGLGTEAAIVRAMPNTPAAVRRGISVAFANPPVTEEQRGLCQRLLEAVGESDWVGDEGLLDIVTAVSGGGPAYVFLFTECLAKAGIKAGLPASLAWRLARVTVSGSGALLRRSVEAPDVLRQHVTSPGGTTEAALKLLLEGDGLQALIDQAVAAAAARSRELGD